jgi:maltooligosyltrehalose synthase
VYAVLGVWTVDASQVAAQKQGLQNYVVPAVRQAPGFVRGFWSKSQDNNRDYTFIVFSDEASAQSFKAAVEANADVWEATGVHAEELRVVEVIADA